MFCTRGIFTKEVIYKKQESDTSYRELNRLMDENPDRKQAAILRESQVDGMLTVDFITRGGSSPSSLQFAYKGGNWINVSNGDEENCYEQDPQSQKLFTKMYREETRRVFDQLASQLKSRGWVSTDFIEPSKEKRSTSYFYVTFEIDNKACEFERRQQAEQIKDETRDRLINNVVNAVFEKLFGSSHSKLIDSQKNDLRQLLRDQINITQLLDSGPLSESNVTSLVTQLSTALPSYMNPQPKTGLFSDLNGNVLVITKSKELKREIKSAIQRVMNGDGCCVSTMRR